MSINSKPKLCYYDVLLLPLRVHAKYASYGSLCGPTFPGRSYLSVLCTGIWICTMAMFANYQVPTVVQFVGRGVGKSSGNTFGWY